MFRRKRAGQHSILAPDREINSFRVVIDRTRPRTCLRRHLDRGPKNEFQ